MFLPFLLLISVQMTSCLTEVYSVLSGYPVSYSSRHGNHNNYLFRIEDSSSQVAWGAKTNNNNQWVQVSSILPEKWVAIVSQGRPTFNQWITKYRVSYSNDGREWVFVDGGRNFTANSDRNTVVRNNFSVPVLARTIRIHPTAWNGWIAMRFDAIFMKI